MADKHLVRVADVLAGIEAYPANMYAMYVEAAKTPEGRSMQADVLVRAVQDTMRKFKIEEKHFDNFGGLVLRISHWLGDLEHSVTLDTEGEHPVSDKIINLAFDMYEDYNRRLAGRLKNVHDGQHRHGGLND